VPEELLLLSDLLLHPSVEQEVCTHSTLKKVRICTKQHFPGFVTNLRLAKHEALDFAKGSESFYKSLPPCILVKECLGHDLEVVLPIPFQCLFRGFNRYQSGHCVGVEVRSDEVFVAQVFQAIFVDVKNADCTGEVRSKGNIFQLHDTSGTRIDADCAEQQLSCSVLENLVSC
jgi:hypothetical protein